MRTIALSAIPLLVRHHRALRFGLFALLVLLGACQPGEGGGGDGGDGY